MFNGATKFGRKLCSWDISNVSKKKKMFHNSKCTTLYCLECVVKCEDDKKFKYAGDKYSCKQLSRSLKKYRKNICKREKYARKLCTEICDKLD